MTQDGVGPANLCKKVIDKYTDKEDNQPLLCELYMKDEFSVES